MKLFFRTLFWVPLLAAVAGVIFFVWQIVEYQQTDDNERITSKYQYLKSVLDNAEDNGLPENTPNIVIILFDDLGYGDVGAFGSVMMETPMIDTLAESGVRLTNYHAPSPLGSPSRAGLLTGRYPPRAGVPELIYPEGTLLSYIHMGLGTNVRLPAEEITLSEVLKSAGYSTGMVGKWQLGDESPSLPNDRGFEFFYGSLYSNDMKDFALYRDAAVVQKAPVDQTEINGHYTREVVNFIERQSDEKPFFLYYAHNAPHLPLVGSKEQTGKSRGGVYGDVVAELDKSVGELVAALEKKGQLNNTLIIVTSDNGPGYQGSAGILRGRKAQTWEGGMRVPFIAHWPAKLPSGERSSILTAGIDIFPTILNVVGIPLPEDREIDGIDMMGAITGKQAPKERMFYYFNGDKIEAVSDGRFKYRREAGVRMMDVGNFLTIRNPQGPWFFDFRYDQQEAYDVKSKYPAEFERLQEAYRAQRGVMKQNPRGWVN